MDQRRLIRHVMTDASSDIVPQKIYRSSLHCCLTTLRNEGVVGLYRGFVPSFMRMGPWNIIFFLVYEQLKKQNLMSASVTADESWRFKKWHFNMLAEKSEHLNGMQKVPKNQLTAPFYVWASGGNAKMDWKWWTASQKYHQGCVNRT
jgi:hypothetical protein